MKGFRSYLQPLQMTAMASFGHVGLHLLDGAAVESSIDGAVVAGTGTGHGRVGARIRLGTTVNGNREGNHPQDRAENMYINNNNYRSVGPMDVDSSRTIAEDYVRYCLEKNGIPWQNGQMDVTPNEIQTAMRMLGDEFESRFNQSFDDIINQLHITVDSAYQTFRTIVEEMFSEGANWGRIVALFGFGGKLAVRCVQQSMPQLVNSIVDWLSDYVDTTLKQWIAANNGWAGFLEFYRSGSSKQSWPSFKTLCSCAAAGLGILTLGAFLSQKS